MQPYEHSARPLSKKQLILNNFLGGIFWGVGSALGAILLIAALGFIVSKLNFIPVIGNFVANINQVVKEKEAQSPIQFPQSEEETQ